MPNFGMRIDGVGGRRRTARKPTLLPAMVQTLGTYHSVEMINISRTGAKLRGLDLPADGESVLVRAGRIDLFGVVVWRTKELCGVHFDEPLDDRSVELIRRSGSLAAIGRLTVEERRAAGWCAGRED